MNTAGSIALGLGDNIDYEIKLDKDIFEKLLHMYAIREQDIHNSDTIESIRNLVCSILYFMKTATGGERFVVSPGIIEKFSSYFKYKITIGGTSPRAAIAMSKLGYASYVHLVTNNTHIRNLLPENVSYICSNPADTSYPHLIIQYTAGIHISYADINIKTFRANRIIYNNDYDNIMMKLNSAFFDQITGAKILLISGFNAVQDSALLVDRLETIKRKLIPIHSKTKVFYEDACFREQSFTKTVWKYLLPIIDFYSLNEDELQTYTGHAVELLNADQMLQAIVELASQIPVPVIIIHTQCYALAYCNTPAENIKEALRSGVTMATTRFRYGDDFTENQFIQTKKLPVMGKGDLFSREIESKNSKIVCIPSFEVTETDVTTIGLGDAFVGGIIPALTTL
jgi:ADP-dependent phosphofructokinase/glucokinase